MLSSILSRFRLIAAAEAEAEQEIIKSIEKEFETLDFPAVDATTKPVVDTTTDDVIEDPSDRLNRLNLMFDDEHVCV